MAGINEKKQNLAVKKQKEAEAYAVWKTVRTDLLEKSGIRVKDLETAKEEELPEEQTRFTDISSMVRTANPPTFAKRENYLRAKLSRMTLVLYQDGQRIEDPQTIEGYIEKKFTKLRQKHAQMHGNSPNDYDATSKKLAPSRRRRPDSYRNKVTDKPSERIVDAELVDKYSKLDKSEIGNKLFQLFKGYKGQIYVFDIGTSNVSDVDGKAGRVPGEDFLRKLFGGRFSKKSDLAGGKMEALRGALANCAIDDEKGEDLKNRETEFDALVEALKGILGRKVKER